MSALETGHRLGQVKQITSTSNPLIKEIKGLALKKNRDKEQLFIAEGLKLVTDAMENGWHIQTLVYSKTNEDNSHLEEAAARAHAKGAMIIEVNAKVLSAISRRDNPQTVLGIFKQQWQPLENIAQYLKSAGDVVLALDRIRDPGNLGTIIRTADAVGVKTVVLIGETTDPFSLEATRATMGSIFNINISKTSEEQFLKWRSKINCQCVGTHLEGAVDYRTIDWVNDPCILVMGNEQQGLTDALSAGCDQLAFIPMDGKADSLNLAIATGVMLFEIRRSFLQMTKNRS